MRATELVGHTVRSAGCGTGFAPLSPVAFTNIFVPYSRPLLLLPPARPLSQFRRAQRDLQTYHKKKHEIVEQAKKQEREAIRDRERAALDIRHMSSSGSYSGAANGGTGETRGGLGRRTPSSGSFFARAAAGASGAGAANGGAGAAAGGGRGAGAPAVQPDQIRKNCVQNNLNEFFMYEQGAFRS